MLNTRQKGAKEENRVVETVYLPLDTTAENVGGGARKRYIADIKTILRIAGKLLAPEVKHTKSNIVATYWKQAKEQAKKMDAFPILHKNIDRDRVVIISEDMFCEMLKRSYDRGEDATAPQVREKMKVIMKGEQQKDPIGFAGLSTKEKEIYQMKKRGMEWAQIGRKLNLTRETVKMKYQSAEQKLTKAQLKYL